MKSVYCAMNVLAFLVGIGYTGVIALHAQSQAASSAAAESQVLSPANPEGLSCSPAPCVLPPVWPASGYLVDAPISANPHNPKQLLLGGTDGNCPGVGPERSSKYQLSAIRCDLSRRRAELRAEHSVERWVLEPER